MLCTKGDFIMVTELVVSALSKPATDIAVATVGTTITTVGKAFIAKEATKQVLFRTAGAFGIAGIIGAVAIVALYKGVSMKMNANSKGISVETGVQK